MMKQLFNFTDKSHRLLLTLIIAGTLWGGLFSRFANHRPVYSAPAAPEVFGSLSGQVIDPQGNPLAGIMVELYEQYAYNMDQAVITDASGHYRIGLIITGIYYVRFYDPTGRYTTQFYPAAEERGQALAVSISGQTRTGIDDTLQVAGQISGRIIMTAGVEMGATELTLYRLAPEVQYIDLQTLTRSEQDFRFGGLRPGRYAVCASNETHDHGPLRFHECYDDHLVDNGTFQVDPITVTAGTTISNVNFVFGDYTNLVAVDGIVMASSGQRLEGVTVNVWRRWQNGWMEQRGTQSTADGTFHVPYLVPDVYALGFTDLRQNYVFEQQNPGLQLQNVITVNLPLGGSQQVVTATLIPGAQITGVVTLQGEAFPNYGYASLYTGDRESDYKVAARVPIDPLTGHYVFKGITSGTYHLYAENYRGAARFTGYYSADQTLDVTAIVLQRSEIKRDMNFALYNANDPYQGSITGKITNNLAPLVGIKVHLFHRNADGIVPFAFTFTDADGNYHIDGLPRDMYFMGFSDPQQIYASIYYPNQRTVIKEDTFWITGATAYTDVNAELVVGGVIEGHVYTSTGEPLAGVTVLPYWREGEDWSSGAPIEATVYTDEAGYYRLPPLIPDTYRLSFYSMVGDPIYKFYSNAGRIENATDIVVRAGMTTQVDTIMEPIQTTYLPLLQR